MHRFEKLGVTFPYFVAPMVGISHVAFRELVRAYTPPSLTPLLFTEMISSKRLPNEHIETAEHLRTSIGESGLIPQLLCNEEEFIAQSIQKLRRLYPWGIDINMGCPVTQTLKHNWGVQLMHDPELAARVVGFAKKHFEGPISVKLRAALGREFDVDYLVRFTRALEDAGADWLTVHCRTQMQGHHGYANWEMVQTVAAQSRVPVVANGDIHNWQDALDVKEKYGVDGVMLARAAIARPWILWQIAYKLGLRERPSGLALEAPPLTPEEEGREYFAASLRLCCLMEEYYGDNPASLKKVFFNMALGSRWLFFGHEFLTRARRCTSLDALKDFINAHRENTGEKMMARART